MVSKQSFNVLVRDQQENCWLKFSEPDIILMASRPEEIKPCLKQIEDYVNKEAYYSAGYISYEAAPAFDAVLKAKETELPLLCFGLYKNVERLKDIPASQTQYELGQWQISLDRQAYNKSIEKIQGLISSGDTYQVNYTIRQEAKFSGDAASFFQDHVGNAPYAAFIETEDYAICSLSPELFFDLQGEQLRTRPMKGTAARGLNLAEDEVQKMWLAQSNKDLAENLMIVDMIRNDLGKIAEPGSIEVKGQFQIEKHDRVWQMTTEVIAKSKSSLTEVFTALFPCASITGAPKVRTMEIIDELETKARNIYTGCIGFVKPSGDAQFNVAIRTALIDKQKQNISCGIGGGIVYDSSAESEYAECLLKAAVFSKPSTKRFELLESLLWTAEAGYFLESLHLKRLSESAKYFDFNFDADHVRKNLLELVHHAKEEKVRLLLNDEGILTLDSSPIVPITNIEIAFANTSIDSQDIFLYHKTTNRQVYDEALAESKTSDVLLWNERGEVTESSIANIVVRQGERLITPATKCGLLPGTYRQYLLDKGEIEEGIIFVDDLDNDSEIYLINSVRKWRSIKLKD